LRRHFHFADRDDRDLSIELDPRSLTAGDVAELAAIGFNRASLGVQDFDPVVQAAVNRVQTVEETLAIIEACRRHGLRSVNVDLIYGLPKQTLDGFARTLDTAIAARPDRLAVYGYAHLPELFKPQRRIEAAELPAPDVKLALLQLAIEKLTAAGYVYIGMDHFALPDDDLALAQARGSLHRNFMGYTTHADSDLVGIGVSAISHVGASFSQNPRDLPTWQAAIDEGRLPVFRGMHLSEDDRLRADLIQQLMCQGEVPVSALERRYAIDFGDYFRDALARLQPMIDDGLVRLEAGRILATSQGRLLLRNIAMCFDRYLDRPGIPVKFSRAI
jgi:oxygen-independent coproporphyrinogen-3 oxidase